MMADDPRVPGVAGDPPPADDAIVRRMAALDARIEGLGQSVSTMERSVSTMQRSVARMLWVVPLTFAAGVILAAAGFKAWNVYVRSTLISAPVCLSLLFCGSAVLAIYAAWGFIHWNPSEDLGDKPLDGSSVLSGMDVDAYVASTIKSRGTAAALAIILASVLIVCGTVLLKTG